MQGSKRNLNGNRATKRTREPRFGIIHTPSKPIASYFAAAGLILIDSRDSSILAYRNSQGISSKATIFSKKLKVAIALAGSMTLKNGIRMVICYDSTTDQMLYRMLAIIAFKTTLLAK